jgi:hypothetical protein
MTPRKVKWFEKKGYKIVDMDATDYFCILKVRDTSNNYRLYAICHPEYTYYYKEIFGEGYKKVDDLKNFLEIEDVDAGRLQAIEIGYMMMFWLYKTPEKPRSMIAGQPDYKGRTYIFRSEDSHKFITEG